MIQYLGEAEGSPLPGGQDGRFCTERVREAEFLLYQRLNSCRSYRTGVFGLVQSQRTGLPAEW